MLSKSKSIERNFSEHLKYINILDFWEFKYYKQNTKTKLYIDQVWFL